MLVLVLTLSYSVYLKEFRYREDVHYSIEIDSNACCSIDYDDNEYLYESYEDFLSNPPEYDGRRTVKINHNIPFYSDEDKKMSEPYIYYSELDDLKRSGCAHGLLNGGMLKTAPRTEDLSVIKPSGFMQVNVKDKYNVTFTYKDTYSYYLYQRCHILAYSLGGEEVDERDIFTGTFSLNMEMQTYEKAVSSFLRSYQLDSVIYRVTPVYRDDNLLASGVLMEGYSKNHYLSFCVYIHNVEDNFKLNYKNGKATYTPE